MAHLSYTEKLALGSSAYVTTSYNDIDDGVTLESYMDAGDNKKFEDCINNYYADDPSGKDALLGCEVVEVCDHDGHGESGFYANVVKMEDGSYVIDFRGSNDNNFAEMPVPGTDAYNEWVKNNLSLLNDTGTLQQQQEAAKFAVEMMIKYDPADFNFVGHSLGGQLSFFAAIYIAENHPEMLDRLTEAINLDGPGYSKEFLLAHKDAIELLVKSGKVEHLQWSIVGDLLYPLDYYIKGETGESDVKTTIAMEKDGTDDPYVAIDRHNAIGNLELDENGHVVPGERDPLARIAGDASRKIDDITTGNLVTGLLGVGLLALATGGVFYIVGCSGIALSGVLASAFPFLAPVAALFGIASAIVATIAAVVVLAATIVIVVTLVIYVAEAIKNIFEAVWKFFTEKKLNGDYSVEYGGLNEVELQMQSIAARINQISNSVKDILSTVQYESAAGWWAKRKIDSAADHIYEAGNKIGIIGGALSTIKTYYNNGDHEAGNLYYFA